MSFGFSVSDVLQPAQFAQANNRNCRIACAEYVEISREVRSFHSVLRTLRYEAQREDSIILRSITTGLVTTPDGCKRLLRDIDDVLSSHEGLNPESGASSAGKTLWHGYRFGSKMEDLVTIRSKTIVYTSTISVVLDTMQLKATGRIESKIDDGFAKVTDVLKDNFGAMRKSIFQIATQARAAQRSGPVLSSTSLSTFAGNDKEVWRDFRRELLAQGFQSRTLHEHKEVLFAYMLKLNQSGILDLALSSELGQASDVRLLIHPPLMAPSFESESEDQSVGERELSMSDGQSIMTVAEARPFHLDSENVGSRPIPKPEVSARCLQRPGPNIPDDMLITAGRVRSKDRLPGFVSLVSKTIHTLTLRHAYFHVARPTGLAASETVDTDSQNTDDIEISSSTNQPTQISSEVNTASLTHSDVSATLKNCTSYNASVRTGATEPPAYRHRMDCNESLLESFARKRRRPTSKESTSCYSSCSDCVGEWIACCCCLMCLPVVSYIINKELQPTAKADPASRG